MAVTERERLLARLDEARNAWVEAHGDTDEANDAAAEDAYWARVTPILKDLERLRSTS